jgi:hypothetical protein
MTVQSKSPEQIEGEIRSTRRDIDRTLDALQTRLSPGQLLDQALGYMKSGGGEFATNFGRTVAQNPIPVTLLGLGALWLMCSPHAQPGSNGRPDEFAGRAREWGDAGTEASGVTAEKAAQWGRDARDWTTGAVETARDYAQAAGDTAREYAHTAGDTARSAAHRAQGYASTARHQATRASETAKHVIDDYPLVVGAVGLAVGAIAAALLPSTRRENELMGTTADEFKQAAGQVVREQVEPIREVAKSATDAAVEEAHRQGLTEGSNEEHASAAERVGMAPGDRQSGTETRS